MSFIRFLSSSHNSSTSYLFRFILCIVYSVFCTLFFYSSVSPMFFLTIFFFFWQSTLNFFKSIRSFYPAFKSDFTFFFFSPTSSFPFYLYITISQTYIFTSFLQSFSQISLIQILILLLPYL